MFILPNMIRYDTFNCNWAATRWQLFSTHKHTNNTGNLTKQTIQRTQEQGRDMFLYMKNNRVYYKLF